MVQQYPEPETEKGKEGTAAHWVLEQELKGTGPAVGTLAPNGVMVTDEMIEGASDFMEWVGDEPGHIEEKIPIRRIHPQCFGTSDFWRYSKQTNILDVVDYKFGHKYVEVVKNPQLISYAIGVLDLVTVPDDVVIRLTVAQPWGFKGKPIRSWETNLETIISYINPYNQAAVNAYKDSPHGTPGSACEYCPGRLTKPDGNPRCSALQEKAGEIANDPALVVIQNIPLSEMGQELSYFEKIKEIIDARVSGLQKSVILHLEQGERIPGYALERGRGKTKWSKPIEDVISMGKLLGVDLARPGICTPKQAEAAGMNPEILKLYSEDIPGKFGLVSSNVVDALAQSVFVGKG